MTMQRSNNALLIFLAVFVAVVVGVFWWISTEQATGNYYVKKGNNRLEDGQFEEAVQEFTIALEKNPDYVSAHLGLAVSYMQMDRADEAVLEFDRVLELDPSLAVAHADKGILLDRLGRYEEALASYKKALELDAEILEGPGWLWRFMRNIDEKPPTIQDRVEYLEEQLDKAPEERKLRVPELDEQQRMYKVN